MKGNLNTRRLWNARETVNAPGNEWSGYFELDATTKKSKFKFQNPIFQNIRHVREVQGLLEFLPPGAIKSVVVFSGKAGL